jgi:hypothetical protein
LISDPDGNVFGGFTPVEWENNCGNKRDDSLRSFLFTLRNPRGVPPRKFALKAEQCSLQSTFCPMFGGGCICVHDNCNENTNSTTSYFGDEYDSVSGKLEGDFLSGAQKFTVKEIEVFEIAD